MRGRKKKVENEYLYIGKTWRIDQDKLNFILQRRGSKIEDGKNWQTVGFYQTVKQLYHALVEKEIKETNIVDIKALNDKVEELHKLIDNATSGIMIHTKEGED